jgi:heptose I phosphotransferase
VSKQVWLNAVFSQLWQNQDVFAAANSIKGEVFRQLEQRQTQAVVVAGRRFFIKRHHGVAVAEILKNLLALRLPVVSARNEYRAISALQKAGVKTPVVAAYGRRGLLPSQLESFLVTEDVGPHQSLEDLCRPWATQRPAFTGKRALLLQLADISRRMHGAGICHRDYYLCHFLKPEQGYELVLIDLHRALVKTRLGQRWIIKDLAGLYFSALDVGLTSRDLLRFIACYRQRPWREVLEAEGQFWRKVKDRAERLYAKHQA